MAMSGGYEAMMWRDSATQPGAPAFSPGFHPKAPVAGQTQGLLDHGVTAGPSPVPLRLRKARRQRRADSSAPVYHVSWGHTWELYLGERRLLSIQLPRHALFNKYRPEEVIMPVPAERLAVKLRELPQVEELAVLVEQEKDPILAARIAGQWFGVHRWLRHPYILSEDEVRAHRRSQKRRATASIR